MFVGLAGDVSFETAHDFCGVEPFFSSSGHIGKNKSGTNMSAREMGAPNDSLMSRCRRFVGLGGATPDWWAGSY